MRKKKRVNQRATEKRENQKRMRERKGETGARKSEKAFKKGPRNFSTLGLLSTTHLKFYQKLKCKMKLTDFEAVFLLKPLL